VKILDRYLTRELLIPIVCCSVSLVFLILIADLFDNLDDLITNKTPLTVILTYYANLAPYAFSQIISWSTWLGTVFLLVSFGLNNETIAMKAAGLKISSIIRPILFLGFLIGILSFLVNDRVVPHTYKTAIDLLNHQISQKKDRDKKEEEVLKNLTFFSGESRLLYIRKFFPEKNEVRDVIVLWLDRQEKNTRQKMIASGGHWDGSGWMFEGVMEYQMDSQGRILGEPQNYPTKTYPEIQVTPEDLVNSSQDSMLLSYKELKDSIQKLQENGVNVDSEKVELHFRLASPWQGLVMMMIAVPLLAPTRNRKAIAGSVLICVGLVFVYHVTGAIGVALGKAGKIFPFLSAWAGNILFVIGSIFTIDRANQ